LKIAIITGATSGLGRYLTLELVKTYEKLIVIGRDFDGLRGLVNNADCTCEVEFHQVDLSDLGSVKLFAETYIEPHKSNIDLLINSAGYFRNASIKDTALEDYYYDFAVNLFSPIFLCKYVFTEMCKNGSGTIVNIGSSSSYGASAETSSYVSSKHALLGFHRTLNIEGRSKGVRTLFVAPGSMQTRMGLDVKNQDYSTFIEPDILSRHIVDLINMKGNIIIDELRVNRMKYE
jgi:3-oxoacyl-[acyl-carrier protein] reductase